MTISKGFVYWGDYRISQALKGPPETLTPEERETRQKLDELRSERKQVRQDIKDITERIYEAEINGQERDYLGRRLGGLRDEQLRIEGHISDLRKEPASSETDRQKRDRYFHNIEVASFRNAEICDVINKLGIGCLILGAGGLALVKIRYISEKKL